MLSPFGVPVGADTFALGGGDWVQLWSPRQVHPYARQWLVWAESMGPSPLFLPDPDVWLFGLQTRDIS